MISAAYDYSDGDLETVCYRCKDGNNIMADDKEKDYPGRSLTGGLSLTRSEVSTFDREDGIRKIGTLRLRGKTDDLPQ